ncbi:hypothetical protein BDZ91DRAFT_852459 [Kalaharituber pfeilii]|nr:hypothetical protein BDZ91DRAFT_852459 [Kalaharituber pfeilii]
MEQQESTFEVLADGTQDLAALVGLFATDSVERYAVDYSRGYLSVAMSKCSLLGILGYVRALVKLGIGSKACQDSAFPTAPVRPILGVAEVDRLPKEELFTVNHIKRLQNKDKLVYEVVKKLNHTEESFPIAGVFRRRGLEDSGPDRYEKFHFYIDIDKDLKGHHIRSALLNSLTASVTSFPVLFIASELTWMVLVASIGLAFGLIVSSIMWSTVYRLEQRPRNILRHRIWQLSEEQSEERSEKQFAIMHTAAQAKSLKVATCMLIGVYGRLEFACRVISIAMGLLICLGYLCQYVEVRKVTGSPAAWWLGTQAVLALLRVLVWIWDPTFDDFTRVENYQFPIVEFGMVSELTTLYFSLPDGYCKGRRIEFPVGMVGNDWIKAWESESKGQLAILNQMVLAPAIPDEFRDALLNKCTATWMFPDYLFSRFLGFRNKNEDTIRQPSRQYTCVIAAIGGVPSGGWCGKVLFVPLLLQRHDGVEVYRVACSSDTTDGGIFYNLQSARFEPGRIPLSQESLEARHSLMHELELADSILRKESDSASLHARPLSSQGTLSEPAQQDSGDVHITINDATSECQSLLSHH